MAVAGGALATSGACNKASPEKTSVATASAPTPEPAGGARVEVTAEGFEPARVVVGADRKLTFRRTTDSTCATAVVFPELGIEKPLPLNKDVLIELPASAPRELSFQCGMAMYKSKVVIQ
jgi:Cu+-exporting ATPase